MGSYFYMSDNNLDAVFLEAVGSTTHTATFGWKTSFCISPLYKKIYFNNLEAFLTFFKYGSCLNSVTKGEYSQMKVLGFQLSI